jgi:hypothetical protein
MYAMIAMTNQAMVIGILCNNCYSKQTNKSTQGIYARWQNRKELDIKQRISKLKASLMQRIIFKSIE